MKKIDKFKKYDKYLLWDLPIEAFGLKIYPILTRDIYDFSETIDILRLNPMEIQASHPEVNLGNISCLELIISLALENKDMLNKFLKILSLAFHIDDINDIKLGERKGKVALIVTQDGIDIEISIGKFDKIKDIICYQNGIEVVDLLQNQRILEANKRIDMMNSQGSETTIEDQIYSLSAISKVDVKEIEKWSIYRFKKMIEAHDNILHYQIFKSAEMSGFVKFKSGNPFKSWITKTKDTTKDLKTISELSKTFGMDAGIEVAQQHTEGTKK